MRWLGFDWGSHEYFASDYFERLYDCAVDLINAEFAYVDSQSLEEIREGRGDFYKPGCNSPISRSKRRGEPGSACTDAGRRVR